MYQIPVSNYGELFMYVWTDSRGKDWMVSGIDDRGYVHLECGSFTSVVDPEGFYTRYKKGRAL